MFFVYLSLMFMMMKGYRLIYMLLGLEMLSAFMLFVWSGVFSSLIMLLMICFAAISSILLLSVFLSVVKSYGYEGCVL